MRARIVFGPLVLLFVSATAVGACGVNAPPSGSGVSGGKPPPPSSDADAGPSNEAPEPQPDGPAPPKVVVTDETVELGGVPRHYTLAVPVSYARSRAYPLVFVLHGDGGNGMDMRAYVTFDDVTGEDAIVVYPAGEDATWDLYTPAATNADDQFLVTLVTLLGQRYNVDKQRVFGVGFSSGAFQINQMACRFPGLFRGINVNAGGAPEETKIAPTYYPNGYLECPGEMPVAALIVHGAADTAVDPASGDFDAQYWAYVNGCADTRSPTAPAPCMQADLCPAGKAVLFCLIPGLAHQPWKEGTSAAWAFFSAL